VDHSLSIEYEQLAIVFYATIAPAATQTAKASLNNGVTILGKFLLDILSLLNF